MAALKYWVWLTALPGLSNRSRLLLLERYGSPEDVYYADAEELALTEGLTPGQAQLLSDKSLTRADRILADCARGDIFLLTMQDAAYPARLRDIFDPPVLLYGKENLLLVAAGELLGLLLRAGALDLQLVNIAVGHGADGLFIAPLHKAAKQALEKLIVDLHGREGNVPLQRLVEQQSHAAAVLRHKGKLRVETAAGRVERNGLAIELDGAARLITGSVFVIIMNA